MEKMTGIQRKEALEARRASDRIAMRRGGRTRESKEIVQWRARGSYGTGRGPLTDRPAG